MKTVHLVTTNPAVELIEPNVERDAVLGVAWLEGELGRSTLTLMGVADKDNKPTSLGAEQERVKGFIERPDQLNWMIQHEDKVVGTVWVDLVDSEELPAPSVHIMIGDPAMHGKGVGSASIQAVLKHLTQKGHQTIYSRHLTKNNGAQKLLESLGFQPLGGTYADKDGLEWQNVRLETATTNHS